MFLMYGSIITLLVKGVLDVGGLDIVWERNFNSSRVEFFKLVPPDIFHLLPFKQIYLLFTVLIRTQRLGIPYVLLNFPFINLYGE